MGDKISGSINVKRLLNGAISGSKISGHVQTGMRPIKEIVSNTKEAWDSNPQAISEKDICYVYTNYTNVDGVDIPNIKIGDGNSYLIDLPFIYSGGVTQEQIDFWNNKVAVMIDPENRENVIFYTGLPEDLT